QLFFVGPQRISGESPATSRGGNAASAMRERGLDLTQANVGYGTASVNHAAGTARLRPCAHT
ncbi:MAG: hypothetical protein PHV28_17535, partial [Kiritimatiellae bacterium]|nr:hypothetical protein [Kiritimatiellia bacterium]